MCILFDVRWQLEVRGHAPDMSAGIEMELFESRERT